MESTIFSKCLVKCRMCLLEIESEEQMRRHTCENPSGSSSASSELIAERAKVWTLSKILESALGVKLESLGEKVESIPDVSRLTFPKKIRPQRSLIKKKSVPVVTDCSDDDQIDKALNNINSRKISFFDVSLKSIEDRLPQLNDWLSIREDRTRLLRYLNGRQWENMVNQHWDLYKSEENFKKENVDEHFSTIEQRVVGEIRYIGTVIKSEDVDFYRTGSSMYDDKNEFFEMDSFIELFINMNLLLAPVERILTEFFQKKPVYIGYTPDKTVDHFAFFTLQRNRDGSVIWKYDCRLEILGDNLFHEIVRYLTYYFRKIYLEIFHDNNYHPHMFTSITSLFDMELRQIITNLLWCESSAKFTKNLQDITRKNCIIPGSHPVSIPPHPDNKEGMKKFKTELRLSSSKKLLAELFDNIEEENIEELLKSFNG